MVTKLRWSHYILLLPLKNVEEIKYYIDVCEKRNMTKRELESLIKSKEYERLSEETKNKLITNEELKLPDLVPNPILIKTENNQENLSEYALKEAILNNLDNFLSSSHSNLQVSIYLKDSIKKSDLKALSENIRNIENVDRVDYLSKKAAMKYFKEIMPENSAILDGLGEANPLPASLEVYLKSESDTKNFLLKLKKMLKGDENVDQIQYDLGYASKILEMLKEFRMLSIFGFILILISFISLETKLLISSSFKSKHCRY